MNGQFLEQRIGTNCVFGVAPDQTCNSVFDLQRHGSNRIFDVQEICGERHEEEHPSGGKDHGRKRRHEHEPFTDYRRAPNADQVRANREDWGILPRAAEIIGTVAKRQAATLDLDAHQRLEELERELEAANIEWESRFLTALNVERERLITAEIGERLRLIQDNRAAAVMLLLLAL